MDTLLQANIKAKLALAPSKESEEAVADFTPEQAVIKAMLEQNAAPPRTTQPAASDSVRLSFLASGLTNGS